MRRRIASAFALWALAGLGLAGCATQSKRADAPLQFRQWNAPAASTVAPAKAPASTAPTPAPDLISSLMGKSAAPAATPAAERAPGAAGAQASASDIPDSAVRPRYRPGSWLFRRFNKPAAAPVTAPPHDPSGSLARFFPTLYGKGPADPARLAQATRPQGAGFGRSSSLSGASIETTGNTVAPPTDEAPLLAEGLVVRAYPRAPSPSMPAAEAVARRDEPARDERLTSHESEPSDPAAPGKPDLIDALSTRMESEPATRPARPDPDDAPTDPAGRATSATVEVPDRAAASDPTAAPAEPERPGIPPLLEVSVGRSSPTTATEPAPVASTPAEPPTPPEPARAEARPAAVAPAAVADIRARVGLARPIDLPEPEFPATYHTESLRQVAREAPPTGPTRPVAIETAPHKPLLPRLSRLLWGDAK